MQLHRMSYSLLIIDIRSYLEKLNYKSALLLFGLEQHADDDDGDDVSKQNRPEEEYCQAIRNVEFPRTRQLKSFC